MFNKNSFFHSLSFFILITVNICSSCSDVAVQDGERNPVQGITESEIHIGSSLALKGHARYLGNQMLQGALCYIHHVNETEKVFGRTIKLTALDDGYDPPQCLFNTQKLILEEKVFALFGYVGTPTTVKIIPLVNEARIPLIGMFTGASRLRAPVNPYLINIRASYYQETEAVVDYMVNTLKYDRIAVFYQYDEYGFDGLRGAEIALQKYDLKPVGKGSYIRGTLDVQKGLEQIVNSRAQAVIMVCTYDPCARFIRLAMERNYFPLFHNVSFVGSEELLRHLGSAANGILITQVVPPPEPKQNSEELPGVAEYRKLLHKYYPESKPGFVGLEGYINAKVLVEGLRRCGPEPDRTKFIKAIESINGFDIGIGSRLSFGPSDHQGLDRIYFTTIVNQTIKPL